MHFDQKFFKASQMRDFNICGAHAINAILAKHNVSVTLDQIVNISRRESKKMLKEHGLTESQTGIRTEHTFNVEALSLTLRSLGYTTRYTNLLIMDRINSSMILSNGKHWIAVFKHVSAPVRVSRLVDPRQRDSVKPKDKKSKLKLFTAYTDNRQKMFHSDAKSMKRWLERGRFTSGLEFI